MDNPLKLTADPAWRIEEHGFDPLRERGIEARLALSNGFLGVHDAPSLRGDNTREGWPGTYVAGLFDGSDTLPRVAMLRSAPEWVTVTVLVDGHPLMKDPAAMSSMSRTLDLQRGLLVASWPGSGGAAAIRRMDAVRLTSMAQRALALQVLRVELDATAEISVSAAVATSAKGLIRTRLSPGLGVWRTSRSGRLLAMASTTLLTLDDEELPPEESRELSWRWNWTSKPGQIARLDHWVAFARAQRGQPPPGAEAADQLRRARSQGAARNIQDHADAWADRWLASDVEVEGDPAAQQALRFAGYHLNGAANPADGLVSIGARALTGGDYLGHVFWDTEIFLLPFYSLTWPEAARALLMYRYHSLDAARAKAARMGWRGAFYAWESSSTGKEMTPEVVTGTDGIPIQIMSGREEEHISADVAYAVWGYWQATEDESFLRDAGAEILFETARFWASRAQQEADGLRHIRDVEGPDEYHEHIDDNAFTNMMARWNLKRGLECATLMKQRWPQRWAELAGRIALTDKELGDWGTAADTIATGYDAARGLYEQFAGFFGLEHIELADYAARTTPMDVVLGRERIQRSQVIKQADTVMLLALLPDEVEPAVRRASFQYYEPRCDHSSSLSPAMHALVAARLGDTEVALRYFRQAAAIDQGEPAAHSAGGVHIACQGGIWQAAVFGFAGLSLSGETVALDPHLPAGWDALGFRVQWRGRRIKLRIEHGGQMLASLEAGEPLTFMGGGETRTLSLQSPVRMGGRRVGEPA